jgi:Predicted membrane protein
MANERADRADRAARLDQPREARHGLFTRPQVDPDTFGRFAEKFARYMGTAKFLVYMTVFVMVWVTANVIGIHHYKWDIYPFIFLTLLLSLQASYAAPLILLAQNRQTDRDRVSLEQDRASNERNLADTEFLTREVASLRIALRDMATRDFLRSELRSLLDEMQERGIQRTTEGRPFLSGDTPPTAFEGPRLT